MTTAQSIFGKKYGNKRIHYIQVVRDGITMKSLNRIMDFTSLSLMELSTILPISHRQLSRYPDSHNLKKEISSHLIQIFELFDKGFKVFGPDKFKLWMRTENRVLENHRPIDIIDTSIGIEMVEDLVGRIEHGVYS